MWKSVAVPNILYGSEILDIGKKEIKNLETVQNKVARMGLRANKYAVTETLRGEMGWSLFEERIEKGKMKYKMRLEFMNENRWAKKVYNWTEGKGKLGNDYKRKLKKYNIQIKNINGNKNITIGLREVENPKKRIHKEINKVVKEKGLSEWKKGIEKKQSLQIYQNKERPKWEPI